MGVWGFRLSEDLDFVFSGVCFVGGTPPPFLGVLFV